MSQLEASTPPDAAEIARRRPAIAAMAREAGQLAASRFGRPGTITSKDGDDGDGEYARAYDVVTDVDFACEKLLLERIGTIAPHAVVLAEEGGANWIDGRPAGDIDLESCADLWLVDPLDGTVNYAAMLPLFCASVAWYSNGLPVAGAIYAPMLDELYEFETGAGAWLNGERLTLDDARPAHETVLGSGGVGTNFRAIAGSFRSWRRIGSAALAMAWTAAGRFGGYAQFGNLNPWDYAVGAPLIIEAGGEITNYELAPWTHPLTGKTGMVCGSSAVHATLVNTLAP